MLDTNTVSYLLRQHPAVVRHVMTEAMASLCLSAITAGEIQFGLAKRPEAVRLHRAVAELLRRVDVLAWNHETAEHYGTMRARLERDGRNSAPLDLLIAAHAHSIGAVLVTNDQSFRQLPDLTVEDWTL